MDKLKPKKWSKTREFGQCNFKTFSIGTGALFTQRNRDQPSLTPPILACGNEALHLESTLKELPLYDFQADLDILGTTVAQMFERDSRLSGVILRSDGQFVGMMPRQRLLEYLLRPYGTELFLEKPLRILHSYDRSVPFVLSGDTAILTAAQQALRRSFDRLSDPIVVELSPDVYRLLDAHDLNIAYWQIRGIETQVRIERLQVQMLQSEKMASLGRLVDGISHEILDPVSFIWGNLSHIADYSRSLLDLIQVYEKYMAQVPREVVEVKDAIEFDYIREDLPKTLDSIKTGAERLSKLANSLQNFCHIDEVYPRPANLHECLDSVLLLLKSQLTGEIEVVKHYGHLPPISCFVSQLSQVFMNILSQAIDGLLGQAATRQFNAEHGRISTIDPPCITITTDIFVIDGSGKRWVSIQIADNNAEWSAETQRQLMQAFATSSRFESNRPLTKETSLAMSYRIVTARHGGKFKVFSRLPQGGTVFEILLPID